MKRQDENQVSYFSDICENEMSVVIDSLFFDQMPFYIDVSPFTGTEYIYTVRQAQEIVDTLIEFITACRLYNNSEAQVCNRDSSWGTYHGVCIYDPYGSEIDVTTIVQNSTKYVKVTFILEGCGLLYTPEQAQEFADALLLYIDVCKEYNGELESVYYEVPGAEGGKVIVSLNTCNSSPYIGIESVIPGGGDNSTTQWFELKTAQVIADVMNAFIIKGRE